MARVVLPVPGGPHRMMAIKERLLGEQAVSFDGAAQQLAGAKDILLPDELIQGARAHAGFVGVGEEVHTRIIMPGRGRGKEYNTRMPDKRIYRYKISTWLLFLTWGTLCLSISVGAITQNNSPLQRECW